MLCCCSPAAAIAIAIAAISAVRAATADRQSAAVAVAIAIAATSTAVATAAPSGVFPGGLSDALCCTGGYAKMLHLDSGLIPLPPARRAKSPLSSHGGVIEPNTLFF